MHTDLYYLCFIREILEADAEVIVLSKWNPFYYELGMHVRKLSDKDYEIITESLLRVSIYIVVKITKYYAFSYFLMGYNAS